MAMFKLLPVERRNQMVAERRGLVLARTCLPARCCAAV